MSDEWAFDAFPFDFDFTDSFPLDDFVPFNDPGFPRFWENIDDIIGGGLDLLGKIGEMFKHLADNMWRGLGGGLRWVWDRIDDTFDVLWRQLLVYFTWVGTFVNTVALWLWNTPSHMWGWFTGGIRGGLHWVWKQAEHWGGVVRDKVDDMLHWVWEEAVHAWGWFSGGIRGGLHWVWKQAEHWGGIVRDKVDDMLHWVWEEAGHAWGWFTGGIRGGLHWVWKQAEHWGGVVRDKVDDMVHWVWEEAGDTLGRFGGGLAGGLGWVVENVGSAADGVTGFVGDLLGGLIDKLGDIFMPIFEGLGGSILDAIKWPFETAFGPFKDTFARKLAIPGKMVRGEYGSVRELVDDISDPPIIDNIVMAFGWGIVGIASLLFALMPALQPVNAKLIQDANVDFRPRLLGEAEILDAELRDISVSHGYDVHLQRWGYRDEDITALRALRQLIPGSGDLVRFAVREAFDRAKAEALGFITPLPGDFALWMARQGFGEEWSERYWWAHWDLPSVTQGFEMLHRKVIEPDDLEGLLIALDIPPKWIPRLLDISYNVITRVDIRRLYQDGIVEEDEVKETYERMGYSPDDARKITDMVKIRYPRGGKEEAPDLRELTVSTIKQAYVRRLLEPDEALDRLIAIDFPEEDAELVLSLWDFDLAWNPSLRFEVPFKDISRSTITDAYRRGVFDFNRAAVELVEAGYTQDDAELLLQLEDLKLQQELTDMEIDLVLQEAKAQDITLAEAETRLLGLGLEPARVTFLIQREELRRMTKTRTLTVSQISRAFGAGIFTEAVFLQKVAALGYTADDAAVLLGLEGPVDVAKRQLSRSEVERLLRRREITRADALGRLTAMDYLPEDAELIVGSVERQLERTLVERLLEQALLTRAEALERLVKAGYSSADAELIVRSREQKMAEEAVVPEPEETPSRELSRTLVEKFLREGLLDREQALDRLVRAGFTRGDAELIILSVERKLAEEALEA